MAKDNLLPYKQPSSLYLLSFGLLCERFSYYGTQAILVLYLSQFFSLSDIKAYAIYGSYTTLAFALPLLGGSLADRFLGFKNAIFLGSILLIIGNLLLTANDFHIFCLGLAVLLCGTGFYKANCTSLVGSLYNQDDPRRESGYTVLYTWINIGASLSAILYGFASHALGWKSGFGISALLNLISFIAVSYEYKHFCSKELKDYSFQHSVSHKSPQFYAYFYISLVAFWGLLAFFLFYSLVLEHAVLVIGLILLAGFLSLATRYNGIERRQIVALVILACFVTCFFAASLQVSSSVNLFISRDVDRNILGYSIPTVTFSSLYPISVIVMGPIFAYLGLKTVSYKIRFSLSFRIIMGLIFAAIGFVFFSIATKNTNIIHLTIPLILLGNLCLGAGELFLMPALLAAISQIAPKRLQGTMMGGCFLFIAFSGYLSSLLVKGSFFIKANFAEKTNEYTFLFICISLFCIIAALFLISIKAFLTSTLKACSSEQH